ncbi:MAG: DUF2066 domain-containing protein [bacterium]
MNKLLMSLSLWLVLTPVVTVADGNLYSAEVPVASDSVADRKAGIRAAFDQMLVKLTGSRETLANPDLTSLRGGASDYMQQYRYRLEPATEPTQLPQRYLNASFDKKAVDRELQKHGVQPWTSSRPRLLVWLVREAQGARTVINTENDLEVARTLRQSASSRAYPLRLPLFDLTDQSILDAAKLWSGDLESISAVSDRYAQNGVLVGRLRASGEDQWVSDWLLSIPEQQVQFASSVAVLEQVLADGIAQAADFLAQHYAPVSAGAGVVSLTLQVLDVADLSEYARVMELIQQQDAVKQVSMVSAMDQQITLALQLGGDEEGLHRSLQLSGELVREPENPLLQTGTTEAGEVSAIYRLR